MKSDKNKTLDLPLSDGAEYLEKCIKINRAVSKNEVTDKIITGDALGVCPFLPPDLAELVIADPPYNIRKNYAGEVFTKMSDSDYGAFTEEWVKAVRGLMTGDASLYVCCDWESGLIIAPVLKKYFHVRNRITWQREKGRGAGSNWKNSMEDIWFCTVSDKYKFNLDAVKQQRRVIAPYKSEGQPKDWEETPSGRFRLTCPSNFWDDISVPFWSMKENTAHPTQKPEKLLAKLILASSDAGDTVFDPFAGSGTSGVTAKKLGRHFTCIEKSPQYCVWAQMRLENADEDNSIQGYENGVFKLRNAEK